MASPSRTGSENSARMPNPLGPMSMIVPAGESTTTCPAASHRVRIPGASCSTVSGESSMSHAVTNVDEPMAHRAPRRSRPTVAPADG